LLALLLRLSLSLQPQRTITAMGKVGIPAEQRESVFATVAAVLHLGNISFVEGKEADSSKVAPGKPQENLQAAGTAGGGW
jgi:myosin-5